MTIKELLNDDETIIEAMEVAKVGLNLGATQIESMRRAIAWVFMKHEQQHSIVKMMPIVSAIREFYAHHNIWPEFIHIPEKEYDELFKGSDNPRVMMVQVIRDQIDGYILVAPELN